MAVYAYIGRQDLESHRAEMLEFAKHKKLDPITFIEETASGRIAWTKRELGRLIVGILPADILIVNDLSHLGRSLLEIMELLSVTISKGVKIFALKGNYELGDNRDSEVVAFAFSLAAEIERGIISGRTKDALAAKKASGKPLGKPKGTIQKSGLDAKVSQIQELLNAKVGKAAIARVVGTSRTNLTRYLKSRNISADKGKKGSNDADETAVAE